MTRIREADPSDVKEMVALDAVCFPRSIRYGEPVFAYFVFHPAVTVLIADDLEGRMIGLGICEFAAGRESQAHLITVDVHPDYRRQGIGSLLLFRLLTKSDEKGLKKMVLEVYSRNAGALAFYGRHGFRKDRLLPNYYGRGKNAILMHKEISDPGR